MSEAHQPHSRDPTLHHIPRTEHGGCAFGALEHSLGCQPFNSRLVPSRIHRAREPAR